MKQNSLIISVALFLILSIGSSCLSTKKTELNKHDISVGANEALPVESVVPDTFILPSIPSTITDSNKRAEYLVVNYWKRFDFKSRGLTERPEIAEQAFVDYIGILNYVSKDIADISLQNTLERAEADSVMYAYFVNLFDKYFYDPNSPFRNEEFYIPVLNKVVNSSLLNDSEISKYKFQLEMVLKNRVGEKANNFNYTLASGKSDSFYNLKSEYVLLMFSNPGCHTCEAVTKQLNSSVAINKALALNSSSRTMLTILTLYPDEDLDLWLKHLPDMPKNWVHGYDKGLEITHKKLYDVKAIPTLYLFDRDKKVILKDTSIEAIENFFATPQ